MVSSQGDRPSAGRTDQLPLGSLGPGRESPFVGRREELRRLSEALTLAADDDLDTALRRPIAQHVFEEGALFQHFQ